MSTFFIVFIGLAAVVLICSNVQIVAQSTEFVVERLGRYHTTWQAGLHIKIPFIEKIVRRVTTKEQVLDSPPQPVITKDNVTMQIDTVVYYRIFDSNLYAYGAVDPIGALANLTATTLRNIVGELELDATLTSRDTINERLTILLDEATDQWGIKVNRVELKNIMPPREIQDAMEKQMKAERNKRQTLLEAEAHKAAAVTRAEGDKQAMVLAAEGERDAKIARAEGDARAAVLAKQAEAKGMQVLKDIGLSSELVEWKRFETLVAMANGQAAKIILPTDVVNMVEKNVLFSETTGIGDHTNAAPPPLTPLKPDACCQNNEKEGD